MRKTITRWPFKWRELTRKERTLLLLNVAAIALVIVSSLLRINIGHFITRTPTLELVQQEIARGDALFDTGTYVPARDTYLIAKQHLDEVTHTAESRGENNTAVTAYIAESLKARIRLAEVGAIVTDEMDDKRRPASR